MARHTKNKFDPAFASIEELAPMLLRREISPVELTKLFIARIEKFSAQLHAYLTVTARRCPEIRARIRSSIHAQEIARPA